MTLITATEYLAQGETDERMELIEGEIVVMNSPRTGHQDICALVLVELPIETLFPAQPRPITDLFDRARANRSQTQQTRMT